MMTQLQDEAFKNLYPGQDFQMRPSIFILKEDGVVPTSFQLGKIQSYNEIAETFTLSFSSGNTCQLSKSDLIGTTTESGVPILRIKWGILIFQDHTRLVHLSADGIPSFSDELKNERIVLRQPLTPSEVGQVKGLLKLFSKYSRWQKKLFIARDDFGNSYIGNRVYCSNSDIVEIINNDIGKPLSVNDIQSLEFLDNY